MSHQVTSLIQFSVFRRPSKTSVLPSFPKQQVVRLRDYFQTMDPCGGENWAYPGIVCSGWKWLFDGLIVNAGTSWSSAYLQVYTRALSCAWMRQKYAPFEVRIITIVHELWLTIHYSFSLVSCWLGSIIFPFNTKRASVSLQHWHTERKIFSGQLTTETIVSFALRSLYHRNGLNPSSINCCSSV